MALWAEDMRTGPSTNTTPVTPLTRGASGTERREEIHDPAAGPNSHFRNRPQTSPVVRPFAAGEVTISPTPVRRFCRFLTISGSKEPSWSRGTAVSTGPTSVSAVLERLPLRELSPSLPAGPCLS